MQNKNLKSLLKKVTESLNHEPKLIILNDELSNDIKGGKESIKHNCGKNNCGINKGIQAPRDGDN